MIRSGIVTVTIVDGVPVLGNLVADELETNRFGLVYEDDFATLTYLGDMGPKSVFWCVCGNGKTANLAITHLGTDAVTIQTALSDPTLKNWLIANTNIKAIKRVSDGAVVGLHPVNVLAGYSPLAIGLGDNYDPEEEYEVGDLV